MEERFFNPKKRKNFYKLSEKKDIQEERHLKIET